MKLTFSPASPFARKVRIAAIETGLIDKIEFVPAAVAPGQPNEEYSKITPLKKLPVLILDNGDVILDSYVIVEYLDELAGGGKLIPGIRPRAMEGQERSFAAAGHARFHAAVPLRGHGAAGAAAVARRGRTITGTGHGPAWRGSRTSHDVLTGPFDIAQIGLVCVLGYADFRFADCGWRKAYPKLDAFHQKMLERPSVKISVPPPA